MKIDIDRELARLADAGLAHLSVGASKAEILDLEETAGRRLPRAYRRFLAVLGRDPGDFLVGTDIRIDLLPELTEAAKGLLEEDGVDFDPPEAWFVFCMHQGYQFLFFDCAESEDPSVWRYIEGGSVECVCPSFSAWVALCVGDESA